MEEGDDFVDWRGRVLNPNRHFGMEGAAVVCVVEILESMVFNSCISNFVTYFIKSLHYPIAEASNMVTNFGGTAFLLTIFGGFISDSFLARCWTFILFIAIELLGLIMLTIQAGSVHLSLKERPSHSQEAILFAGLYAMAIGAGGVKATLQAHGADQLDHSNKRLISSFFNWYFFSFCTGALLSATIMVWIEENKGWKAAFIINIVALSLALFIFSIGFLFYRNKRPSGSPITRIFKVLQYTARNWKESSLASLDQNGHNVGSHTKLRFLNKAMAKSEVSWAQVGETRIFLRLLPIFASTVMMNCCLVQLQTFSVQQGIAMNRRLSKYFVMPPASLAVIPIVFVLSFICFYERVMNVFVKNLAERRNTVFPPLKRVGLGLVLASVSMAIAAIVEVKRREAGKHGYQISVFWLAWQYLILGVSDFLTLGGMLEFFYSEAPTSMRGMSTALAWCSMSMGAFLSSLLVKFTNAVSGQGKHHPWLADPEDMNNNRLDLFFALLCVLNFLNFLNFVYMAKRY